MKKHLTTILLVVVLLVGAGLLLYPSFSDYVNSYLQSRAITSYSDVVSNLNAADYERIWRDAVEYNVRTSGNSTLYTLSEEEREAYNAQLNISGNGIMGYIDIPKIDVSLPIYHGTEEDVLQVAVGHIESSSLPVGGSSTHCVLSGHRGLPSAKLFTDLDQLSEGDIFQLQILNETMTYEVDQIRIVLPQEVNELSITEGRDYCTLVTCTPYGINTHRMLVRGTRIENPEAATTVRVTADAMRIDPVMVAPVAAAPMLLVLLLWMMINPGGKKKKKKKANKARKKKGNNMNQENNT